MSSSADVSVIVVSFNTGELTLRCLEAVFAKTEKTALEVIVVDNASTDGSPQLIAERFPQVRLIGNNENRGFAAANNQGLKIARGRYSLLLNSDATVLDGAIDACVAYADRHPDIGVLGPKVLWPDGSHQDSVMRFTSLLDLFLDVFQLGRLFPNSALFNRFWYASLDWNAEHEVDVVSGCCFLVRREVLEQVGLLDEDFFMYGEEAEWCYRIRKAGWRITYCPAGSIVHIWGGSSPKSHGRASTRIAKRRAQLLFLDKTRGRVRAWAGNLIMLAGVLLRLPVWLLLDLRDVLSREDDARSGRWRIARFHLRGVVAPAWTADIR
jgi:GT2 family glycosyltransferase